MERADGEPPFKWKSVKVADVSGEEVFVKQMLEMVTILEAGMIVGAQRDEAKHAIISTLMDGLMPAFLELQQIRASVGKDLPLMNRDQLYEDFARKLWKAYKELMQKAAELIGFKIGFIFRPDKEFREGLVKLRRQHPTVQDWFEKYLEGTREHWQNDLAKFRNTWVEHQQGDRKQFEKFYKPDYAEMVFHAVWDAIVTILAVMLEVHLPHGTKLVEQHPDDPSPRCPNRFHYKLADGYKLEE